MLLEQKNNDEMFCRPTKINHSSANDYSNAKTNHSSANDHSFNAKSKILSRDQVSYDKNVKAVEEAASYFEPEGKNQNTRCSSSDEVMKYYAFHVPFGEIKRCNPDTCPYKGTCIDEFTFSEMMKVKTDFWGPMDSVAPSRSTRKLFILSILQRSFRSISNTFEFVIGSNEKNNRLVCEAAYLIALGLINNSNASSAPSQWRLTKKWVLQGFDKDATKSFKYSEMTNQEASLKERKKLKFDNAVNFIYYFAHEFGDTVPGGDTGITLYNNY